MQISWKAAASTLVLTLSLVACTAPSSGPQADVLTAPAEPVASTDTDIVQAQSVAKRAQTQAQGMLSRDALTPDLYDALNSVGLLNAFGPSAAVPMAATTAGLNTQILSPTTLGRSLLGQMGNSATLSTQAVIPLADSLLGTGTIQVNAQGFRTKVSELPLDGYVVNDVRTGTTLKAEWKVDGAGTVFVASQSKSPTDTYTYRTEYPTHARITASKTTTTKIVAVAEFKMTPGACMSVSGPDSLSLDIWAGTPATPELKAKLDYAWNAQGISLTGDASLSGNKGVARADVKMAVLGSTTDRCDLSKLSFTPSKIDASATASLPGDSLNAELKVRDLSNVVISSDELKLKNPFATVQGTLQASARHNDKPFFSAFGPLADGADLDLVPGDGVLVRFVKGTTVVTANLQSLF